MSCERVAGGGSLGLGFDVVVGDCPGAEALIVLL